MSKKYHKSTETILKSQLGGALDKPKVLPREQRYEPLIYTEDDDDYPIYDGDTYSHLDTWEAEPGHAEEIEAERIIETMECDPSYISQVAYRESASLIAEVLRQLLLR